MSNKNFAGLDDAKVYQCIGENYDMDNHVSGAAGHMREVPDEFISRFAITGKQSYCVDRLADLLETGLDRLVLLTGSRDANPDHVAASVGRLSRDVLPQLR